MRDIWTEDNESKISISSQERVTDKFVNQDNRTNYNALSEAGNDDFIEQKFPML